LFRFEAKQSEKTFISLRFEAKQSKKRLFRSALKRNKQIRSETKQNEKMLEAKQSENTVYLFCLSWKRKIRSEKKRKRNACEKDLVSLRFALKQKLFWGETGAP
jgi:hypothetical protein